MSYKTLLLLLLCFACRYKTGKKGTVTCSEFENNVVYLRNVLKDSSTNFSIPTAIELTKIKNSIFLYNIDDSKKLYSNFCLEFDRTAARRIIIILDMKISIGMSYYSKKYDLNLGAWPDMHNSYYLLDSSECSTQGVRIKSQ